MAILMIVAILLVGPWCVGSGLAWLRMRTEGSEEDPAPGSGTRDVAARRRALPPAA